jgi:hypothetical protein
MARTKGQIDVQKWLRQHGVAYERVKDLTVDTRNARQEWGVGWFDVKVTHTGYPGWVFTLGLLDAGGVVQFHVDVDSDLWPDTVITARALREVNLGDMALGARAHFGLMDEALWRTSSKVRKRERNGGKRPPVTDELLVRAMLAYLAHGTSAEAAKAFHCSKYTMDHYRKEAVRRGLFVSRGHGRSGGYLTDEGERIKEGLT